MRKELLDAMKAKPGQVTVPTAGVTSAGHNAMDLITPKSLASNTDTSHTTVEILP
jgi:tripartite-type tricarboxylate transporter receptor subunit TctC